MAVVIAQVVTETVVAPTTEDAPGRAADRTDQELEAVVRRATERVLETLRREWDR